MIIPVVEQKGKSAKTPAGTHPAIVTGNKVLTRKGKEGQPDRFTGVIVSYEVKPKTGEGGIMSKRYKANMAPGEELRTIAEAINGKWNAATDDLDILNGKACQVVVVVDNKNPGGATRARIDRVLKVK